MEPYKSSPGGIPHLPHTDLLSSQVLCVPTGTAVGAAHIRRIAATMRLVFDQAEAINERMTAPAVA
jgi:hypothetical protein